MYNQVGISPYFPHNSCTIVLAIYSYFGTFLCNLFNKCFALVKRKVKVEYKEKSYVTPEIKAIMRERDKVYKKYVKYPTTYGKEYHRLRNKVTDLIKAN